MRKPIFIQSMSFIFCLIFFKNNIHGQPQFELSENVYRIPYEGGTTIQVKQDFITHSPPGRFDLRADGTDDCNTHQIVAAAEGIVRRVVENNTLSCPSCGTSNNYVWIEHANGEWSKYTHFKQNSVTVSVNDQVCVGTVLGLECWVGGTSPAQYRHLHFEVRRPFDNANPVIDPAGGFMDDADHMIPVMNSFSKHYFEKDDSWTATSSTSCVSTNIIYIGPATYASGVIKISMASGTITNNSNAVIFQNGSDGMFHAGGSITLSPGFHGQAGTYFHGRIGSCATTNLMGACN